METKMNSIMLIVVLCLSFQSSLCLNKQMILDVIQYYKGNVAAKLCWPMCDKIDLATMVMSAEDSRSIQFFNNFKAIEKSVGENLIIVLDLTCPDSQKLLHEVDVNKMFEKPFTWVIVPNENTTRENVPIELLNLSILINSEVVVANKMVNDDGVSLDLIYKIDSTSDMITESLGAWTPSTGLHINDDMKMATGLRRRNLKGKTITMSVVAKHESTKTEIYNINNIMTDIYAKSSFINIAPLYDFMNATKQLIFIDTWGYTAVNNSWNGMLGHMQRGDADLCGTIVLMTSERHKLLDYLATTYDMRTSFVFLAPPLSLQNNLFVLPFKSTVWACIGALIVVFAAVIYVNARWERTKGAMIADDPTTLHPNASDVALCIASALTQQGSSSGLKSSLGRVVTFTTLLSFLFLYTSYAASIVALLQSTSDQIRTLSDLLNSKLELGVEDQPYNRHYFTTATDRVRKEIYENKVARVGYKPNFMDIYEGVKRIQTSSAPFAFHMDLGHGYQIVNKYFLEHEKCGLREIPYLPKGRTWFCCPKKSPYSEIYKLGLVRISEHGITDRLGRQVSARKPACVSSGGTVASVNMVDFRPVLLCWLYGVIAAFVVLVLEIIVHRRRETSYN